MELRKASSSVRTPPSTDSTTARWRKIYEENAATYAVIDLVQERINPHSVLGRIPTGDQPTLAAYEGAYLITSGPTEDTYSSFQRIRDREFYDHPDHPRQGAPHSSETLQRLSQNETHAFIREVLTRNGEPESERFSPLPICFRVTGYHNGDSLKPIVEILNEDEILQQVERGHESS